MLLSTLEPKCVANGAGSVKIAICECARPYEVRKDWGGALKSVRVGNDVMLLYS